MKKILSVFSILLILCAFTYALDEKEINAFGGLGFAAGDFEGLLLFLGAELQMTEKIFVQFLLDYYFNPSGENMEGINDSAYGLNFYGVYKHPLSEKMKLFGKAGFHYTTVRLSAGGVSVSTGDLGIAGGAGLEYALAEKIALILGATYKIIFSEGESGSWFKFYGGINYRVK